ncbi:hypothetical protein A3Q32_19735 [Alcanivorax sp. KX64203]|nr:hypothetical protein A3Q32_19735 [Alcanivorax sp. KX64203]
MGHHVIAVDAVETHFQYRRAPSQPDDLASAIMSTGAGLLRKLIFRFCVTAISSAPSRPRITAYMAESANPIMVGPEMVPPGRIMDGLNG